MHSYLPYCNECLTKKQVCARNVAYEKIISDRQICRLET